MTPSSRRGEVRQVPRPPSDHRQPGCQCFAIDRPVRLAVAGQDERIGGPVQAGHLGAGDGPWQTTRSARSAERSRSRTRALYRGSTSSRPTRCRIAVSRDAAEGLEELERALAGHPVADAQERNRSPLAEIRQGCRWRRDVAARGDDDDAFGRQAVGDDELVGQRGAGGDQQVAATVERTIEPSLHGRCGPP